MKAIKAAMPYESSVQYSTIFNRDWKRIKYIHISRDISRLFEFIYPIFFFNQSRRIK